MGAGPRVDDIDRRIISLLVENGRRTVLDIALQVQLTPAPVKRRIDRLERLGVIAGYTTLIDQGRLDGGLKPSPNYVSRATPMSIRLRTPPRPFPRSLKCSRSLATLTH